MRINSIIKYDYKPHKDEGEMPFNTSKFYIYLGEIPNMLGHCIIMDYNTKEIYTGIHIDMFREATENEW